MKGLTASNKIKWQGGAREKRGHQPAMKWHQSHTAGEQSAEGGLPVWGHSGKGNVLLSLIVCQTLRGKNHFYLFYGVNGQLHVHHLNKLTKRLCLFTGPSSETIEFVFIIIVLNVML